MSDPSPDRVYAGASSEERRDDRRRRLIDAALEVIGTEGWSAATVRRVAAQARTAPRFFYEQFGDMDGLACAAHDEITEEALGNAVAAIAAAPDDILARSRAAVASVVSDLTDDPRRARLLLSDAPVLVARRQAALRALGSVIAQQAREAGVLAQPDRVTLEAVSLLVAGGAIELARAWLDGTLALTKAQIVEICAQVLVVLAAHMPEVDA